MRFIRILGLALACVLAISSAAAATYKLSNGQEVTGELLPTSANETGVQVKVGEGQYERVLWGNMSQEDLRTLAQNSKLQPLVEPFIEITQEERLKQTEVKIKPPPRLAREDPRSVIPAMFKSGVGIFVLFLVYAATIYAGYEVAIFRARPPALVAGLSAIPFLGMLAPILFLSMPTRLKADETSAVEAPTDGVAGEATPDAVNPMQAEGAAHPTALHIAHEEKKESAKIPQSIVYQRGQYTFNRRFIETKFVNFFGVVRRDVDKDMVLVIKSARGTYTGHRISRIAANDLHLEVHRGAASEEILIPFVEIQEVRVQHKDAQ